MKASNFIVLTGPESSGKSYLGKQLSERFELPLVEEYARDYLDKLDRAYRQQDLSLILAGQYELLKKQFETEAKLILMDTDGITMRIWSTEKYQQVSSEIDLLLKIYPAHHYLLLRPDIPWEPDPLRENPVDRDRLFELYETELNRKQFSYTIIEGSYTEREMLAEKKIKELLENLP